MPRAKVRVICPNCNNLVVVSEPFSWHKHGCLLGSLLVVLHDRGHYNDDLDPTGVDVDHLWEKYGGPAADFVAEQIGLTPYPED